MSVTLASLCRAIGIVSAASYALLAASVSSAQDKGVLREVWTNISGNSIDNLTTHPNFPDSPTLADTLPTLSSPVNFGSNYGTRLRAFLKPSVSGEYTFWIQGDDSCVLFLSPSSNPSLASQIASVPGWTSTSEWEKYEEQKSQTIALTAGQTYYIEALHKEGGGGDHVSVNWALNGTFERSAIPSELLTPFESAPTFDPNKQIYISTGADIDHYLPAQTVSLHGSAFARSGANDDFTINWIQTSGANVTIENADTLNPSFTANQAGTLTFELSIDNGEDTQTDTVTVTVHSPLDPKTGSFIQEIWLDLRASHVEELLSHGDYPTRPHLIRTTDTATGPRNWGDQYGVRTRGLITPPKTGNYTFYVMADDAAAIFLSSDSSEENVELLAFTPERTGENIWTKFEEQVSEPVLLEKGKTYYFEMLFVERWSGDYHGAAWSFEDGAIKLIGGEFFIPQKPEDTNIPNFDDAELFAVEAGPNQTLHTPDTSTILRGKTLRISGSYQLESIQWRQTSGPANATISGDTALEAAIALPAEGTYSFELSATASGITASDTVTISRLPALSDLAGGFTREVWLNVDGSSVENLLASERYPDRPDIVDQLPSLTGPINWATRYGSRSSGFLIPTRTGPHTFYVTADDAAILKLAPDTNRNNAVAIASSSRRSLGDYRDASQTSAPIDLVAGKRYYIELLHKQSWGGDHFQVAWSFGDENAPLPIGGGFVEPYDSSIANIDTALTEYAYAGPDRHYYSPTSEFELNGKVLNRGDADNFRKFTWTYLGNSAGVSISDSDTQFASAKVPGTGDYTFRLTLQTHESTHYDDITISVLPALDEETAGLLRSVWLNQEGSRVDDMMTVNTSIDPSFEDIIPNAEPASNWTDYYSTRLMGYLHPPETGDYEFWIAADDTAQLRISTSENPEESELVAEVMRSVRPREWDREDSQRSAPIALEASKKYFIEVLQKEARGDDHLSVAWQGPGLNDREIITAGYLSPAYDVARADSEIVVLAGADQTIQWPDSEIDLLAHAFDQDAGPDTLVYQWSATPANVTFSYANSLATNATFSAAGNYTLTITVSDGLNTASDSLSVTISDPVDPDVGAITREVWLDVGGYTLEELINHPNFPNSPDIVDTLPNFEAPSNWADYYGTRLSGYIVPPVSGSYQLYAIADDRARVSINTQNESFDNLTPIIEIDGATYSDRWDVKASQASAPLTLQAGKRYPIEVLHKEKTGRDYVALGWKRPDRDEIELISGNFLVPSQDAPLAPENIIVIAPEDIEQRWPQNTFDLSGIAIDLTVGPEALKTRWEQESGPGEITFAVAGDLQTNAHASQPGEYEIRLYADDGSEEAFDSLTVVISEPLDARTGAATRSTFSEIKGDRVVHLVSSEKFPDHPDYQGPLGLLDAPQNEADNYGTLVQGYLHPPLSGTYRFSVTGDDWAEVWLSTDDSTEKKAILCFTPAATDFYEWDKYPEYQTSAEVSLEAGKNYYLEIRHKESGWRDHFSIAWLRPDREEMEIVQGGYLSPYGDISVVPTPKLTIAGLPHTTIFVGESFDDPGVRAFDSDGNDISDLVIVTNTVNSDRPGSYSIRYQVINPYTGFAETVVRTVNVVTADSPAAIYPDPTHRPPVIPDWDEPAPSEITDEQAARFLTQATFGTTKADIQRVKEIGYSAWIDEQLDLEPTLHKEQMLAIKPILDEIDFEQYNEERLATWWTTAITAKDQLRQRVAFALSEIMVISDKNAFTRDGLATANYYDILVRNSFGNYNQLLEEVTLNPMMGQYLTMLRSSKASPDENYAREVMQLFSIGLILLNPDGSPLTDDLGNEIPTYDQRVILELSRAFTGWTFAGSRDFNYTDYGKTDYLSPMIPFEEYHDSGAKELMGGFILPQGLSPREDLRRAVGHIADHPNVGPFIARRLIQRLVTSNPSPGYICQVAQTFEDDGTGTRGNLGAVVKAILLYPEAREPETFATNSFGKLREPIIRLTHLLRSFEASSSPNAPVLGRYPISNTSTPFGQSPMQANSVFNFFDPDYAPPGEIMDAGLTAPEFDITTELTTVDTANFLHRVIDRGSPTWYRYSTLIQPQLDSLIENAKNVDSVINEIDLLIMSGSMSDETRNILRTTLEAIDEPEARAESALKLLISSPEYSVQK